MFHGVSLNRIEFTDDIILVNTVWRGTTRSGIGALKVPFSVKMNKMPLVNPRFTESQIGSRLSQNNLFDAFTSNPSYVEVFVKFDPRLTFGALKTLIFIRTSKRVGTSTIVKIIKFPFEQLFMGQNQS